MSVFLGDHPRGRTITRKTTTVFQAACLIPCHCRLVFKPFRYFYNAPKIMFLA